MSTRGKKILFVDRDGTLCVEREGYLQTPDDWAPLPGALDALSGRKVMIDPAVSSAVFVTATTDFFGFLIFLGLATIILL